MAGNFLPNIINTHMGIDSSLPLHCCGLLVRDVIQVIEVSGCHT
jgi:hypothetical protein